MTTTENPGGVNAEGTYGGGHYGIVVFSHLRWGFVWQRPQQFLSRFAQSHPILFVEEPVDDLEPGQEPQLKIHEAKQQNIWIAVPHLPRGANWDEHHEDFKRLTREAIDRMPDKQAFRNPLFWFYSPMMSEWALDAMPHRGIVYDCMDELSQFRGAHRALVENERRLMQHAHVMFTGGYKLLDRKSQFHDNVHCFGCGVEYDHFARAQDDSQPIPEDMRDIKKPIVGWFGVIDERVDYDLIRKAAELRPDVSFVMVGPVVKVDESALPKADNIHWLGPKDYQELPDYCRGFDVCMMCFAINEATEYINPTKALEYLATGRPVISTPVQDVVRQYQDTVTIVNSADELVKEIDRLTSTPDQDQIRRGVELAQKSSWEGTVSSMRQLIDQSIREDSSAGNKDEFATV